ncbi:hypothetical protein ZHAS_00004208 [Anopheles sinensis]|uniref:Uncharacterized protein n=1 Tax=Anopheles sinensis TaxID=74873 RepID=A0A084VGC8_ANOSI|nr:hypothetical protein ZHAS_00004208 [Anopheles sinensis]
MSEPRKAFYGRRYAKNLAKPTKARPVADGIECGSQSYGGWKQHITLVTSPRSKGTTSRPVLTQRFTKGKLSSFIIIIYILSSRDSDELPLRSTWRAKEFLLLVVGGFGCLGEEMEVPNDEHHHRATYGTNRMPEGGGSISLPA